MEYSKSLLYLMIAIICLLLKITRYSSDINTSMLNSTITEDQNGINSDNVITTTNTNGLNAIETSDLYWIDSDTILVPFKDGNLNKLYLQSLDITNDTAFIKKIRRRLLH